jgi:hypothetical protein
MTDFAKNEAKKEEEATSYSRHASQHGTQAVHLSDKGGGEKLAEDPEAEVRLYIKRGKPV